MSNKQGTSIEKGYIDGVYTDFATEADKATVATYASEDTSKGTIEERLSELGL